MKDYRLRQPVDPDYALALGRACYCFAICEWNAVYCAERIRPGSLGTFIKDEATAGKIAKKLTALARNLPKSAGREELVAAAKDFSTLVELRNALVHGKPCTGPSGAARLFTQKVFEVAHLDEAADAFSACSIELNRILYGFLTKDSPNVRRAGDDDESVL